MNRKSLSAIMHLTDEQKKALSDEIVAFYHDVLDEEVGVIKQQQIIELFEEKMAPIIYNKALDDARKWYSQVQANMESDFWSLYKQLK